MTNASYPSRLPALKSQLPPFCVVVGKCRYTFQDIVTASLFAHSEGGELFEVMRLPSGLYERYRREMAPVEVVRDCASRVPRKAPLPGCVPVFGR